MAGLFSSLAADAAALSAFSLETAKDPDRAFLCTAEGVAEVVQGFPDCVADAGTFGHICRITAEIVDAAPHLLEHLKPIVPHLSAALQRHVPQPGTAHALALVTQMCAHDDLKGAIHGTDTLQAVQAVLDNSKEDPQISRAAAEALRALVKGEPAAQVAYRQNEGIQVLLDVMEAQLAEPAVLDACAGALAALSEEPSNRAPIGNDGALDILLNLLKDYKGQRGLMANAMTCLAALSGDEGIHAILEEDGGIDVVVSAAAALVTNADVALHCLAFLRNVAARDSLRQAAVEAGAIELLTEVLRDPPAHDPLPGPPIAAAACQALAGYAADGAARQAMVDGGALDGAVRALATGHPANPADAELHGACLALLLPFSAQPPQQKALVAQGLVEGVGRCMQEHLSSPSVQAAALAVLTNLSQDAGLASQVLQRDAGLAVTQCLMQGWDPDVIRQGCRLLALWVSLVPGDRQRLLAHGAAPALVSVIEKHLLDPEAVGAALDVALQLCQAADAEDGKRDAPAAEHQGTIEAGILDQLVNVMERHPEVATTHPDAPSVVMQCVTLAARLSAPITDAYREAMYTERAVSVVLRVMSANLRHADVQLKLCWLFEKFWMDQEANGGRIARQHGVQTMQRVMEHHQADEKMVHKALEVVSNVSEDDASLDILYREIDVGFLLRLLRMYPRSDNIQETIAFILAQLGVKYAAEIVRAGGAGGMVTCVATCGGNAEVLQYAWIALEKLCASPDFSLTDAEVAQLASAVPTSLALDKVLRECLAALVAMSAHRPVAAAFVAAGLHASVTESLLPAVAAGSAADAVVALLCGFLAHATNDSDPARLAVSQLPDCVPVLLNLVSEPLGSAESIPKALKLLGNLLLNPEVCALKLHGPLMDVLMAGQPGPQDVSAGKGYAAAALLTTTQESDVGGSLASHAAVQHCIAAACESRLLDSRQRHVCRRALELCGGAESGPSASPDAEDSHALEEEYDSQGFEEDSEDEGVGPRGAGAPESADCTDAQGARDPPVGPASWVRASDDVAPLMERGASVNATMAQRALELENWERDLRDREDAYLQRQRHLLDREAALEQRQEQDGDSSLQERLRHVALKEEEAQRMREEAEALLKQAKAQQQHLPAPQGPSTAQQTQDPEAQGGPAQRPSLSDAAVEDEAAAGESTGADDPIPAAESTAAASPLSELQDRERELQEKQAALEARQQQVEAREAQCERRGVELAEREGQCTEMEQRLSSERSDLDRREKGVKDNEETSAANLVQSEGVKQKAEQVRLQAEQESQALAEKQKAFAELQREVERATAQTDAAAKENQTKLAAVTSREKEVEKQKDDVVFRERALVHKEKEAESRDLNLERRDAEMKKKEKVQGEKGKELDAREKRLLPKEKEVNLAIKDLERRENANRDRNKKCELREDELDVWGAELQTLAQECAAREARLAEDEAAVQAREEDIAQREQRLESLGKALDSKSGAVQHREDVVAARERTYKQQHNELVEAKKKVEKREQELLEWLKELEWREQDFQEREEAHERPASTLKGMTKLKSAAFNESLISVQLSRMKEAYITSKDRMLRERARQLPDVLPKRDDLIWEVKDWSTLKAMSKSVYNKAAEFRRVMARLRGFDGAANPGADTQASIDAFSEEEIARLSRIKARDQELCDEGSFLVHLLRCPMNDRQVFDHDAELVVALERWWVDARDRVHGRQLDILKARLGCLDRGLELLQSKSSHLPSLFVQRKGGGLSPADKKRGGVLFPATFPAGAPHLSLITDPWRRPYAKAGGGKSPYGRLPAKARTPPPRAEGKAARKVLKASRSQQDIDGFDVTQRAASAIDPAPPALDASGDESPQGAHPDPAPGSSEEPKGSAAKGSARSRVSSAKSRASWKSSDSDGDDSDKDDSSSRRSSSSSDDDDGGGSDSDSDAAGDDASDDEADSDSDA